MEFVKRVFGFHKTPPVLVECCLFELNCIVNHVIPPKGRRLNKRFNQMKNFLFGKGESEPEVEECEELAQEIINNDVILQIIRELPLLTVQERNSYVQVVATLASRDHAHFSSEYMVSEKGDEILSYVLEGLSDDDLSVHCGLFLRECVKSSPIHNHILTTGPYLEQLFTHYVFNARFDSCSDVLQVLCDLLRRNKQMVAVTLNADPELCNNIFLWIRNLIQNGNYVVTRVIAHLLSLFLSDSVNLQITLRFLNDTENLMIVMNLLCSPYQSIQLDAFDMFKLFAANTNGCVSIKMILRQNRAKLLSFLPNFLPNYEDDTFKKEKKIVLRLLSEKAL